MRRFALDEDFPDTILNALDLGVPEAEMVPIRNIDPRLRSMDDWQLLLSLYHLEHWDGLITIDGRMLNLPKEVAVLHQTNLTLVVVEQSGHDPIRAAGLLLVHLPVICRKTVRTTGQIWNLNAQNKNHESPWDELKKIAHHQKANVKHLYEISRLSKKALMENPLQGRLRL